MTTVSAHDVAAAIRERLPNVGKVKLHKLLYYAQGYHLARFDVPLFREQIHAFNLGPVCADLWHDEDKHRPKPPPTQLDDRQLNTIGYVASRFGSISEADLIYMTHAEVPWQEADRRRHFRRGDDQIPMDALHAFFRDRVATDAAAAEIQIDPADLAREVALASANIGRPGRRDSVEGVFARLAGD